MSMSFSPNDPHQQAIDTARRAAYDQQRQFFERLREKTSSQSGDNRNGGSSALGRFLFMIIVLGFLAILGFFGFMALTIVHH
jgi:hypothetical protein